MSNTIQDVEQAARNAQPNDALSLLIERIILRARKHRRLQTASRSVAGAAAAFLVFLFIGVNVSPALAAALEGVPLIGPLASVMTIDKVHEQDEHKELDVETPQVAGLNNRELEDALNALFADKAQAVIDNFQALVMDAGHTAMQFGYEVLANDDALFTIDIITFEAQGSSMTWHNYYTVDLKQGKIVTLADLFVKDADYASRLTELVRADLDAREAPYFPEDYNGVSPDQSFFLDADGRLVICFEKYAIAPGYVGEIRSVIPTEAIADLLAEGTPLR
ncbi:MAG TPA: DUF3298 domain-containing protein [Clostridia bacterium]|nr:DUF3298 domain-containing protein [Clostridia bacterium]